MATCFFSQPVLITITDRGKNTKLTHFQRRQAKSPPWYHNIRRQLPPRRRRRKNGKQKPGNGLPRSMLQMSLIALSFLAFGTMIAGMLMRNSRSPRPGKPVVHNILIKPSPKMEESTTEGFISHLIEGGLEMIGEAVAKMLNWKRSYMRNVYVLT